MLIERYLFRQLLGPTVVATAALTGVAILASSLSALDILVSERQSPLIFFEVTMLGVPQLLAVILPLASFVAALVALNRLQTEQEITICFAGGVSRWRVAAPAIRLAGIVAIIALVMGLWVQPLAFRTLRHTLEAVKADLASTMIRPGEFTHPAAGLSVYAQSMDDDGAIHNLFIYQQGGKEGPTALTASEGRIAKRYGSPVLIMRHGSNQRFSTAGVLNFLSFDEYEFDLRPFIAADSDVHYRPSDRYLHELFFPDLRQPWERDNLRALLAEGNSRLASPLYNLSFVAIALAAVLGGSFNRLGYGARIAVAAVGGLTMRLLGFVVEAVSNSNSDANVLQYLVPVTGFIIAMLIVLRQRPLRGRRDSPAVAARPLRSAA
ncbi:MAG: LPS export ABC transporter permease LptF [Caulobacterales bacterium]